MRVLDTDFLTIVQRKEGPIYSRLNAKLEAASATQPICVTMISFEEQMRGWLSFIARAKTVDKQVMAYRRLHVLLDDFHSRTILDFDDRAAALFEQLVKAKIRVGTMDLKIAAITLVNNATLLSRNLAHFRRVPGLRVEDWTK